MADPAGGSGRLTYGALVEQARRAAASAAGTPPSPSPGREYAAGEAAGLALLAVTAGRHVRFLARPVKPTHPARLLAGHAQVVSRALVGMGQPDRPAATASRWHGVAERLAIAHDLLLARIGPDREPLGPDARLLTDPDVIAAAARQVADILLLAAKAADDVVARSSTPAPGGRIRAALLAPSTLWPLRLVAGLGDPAAAVADLRGGMSRPYVLDDVGPLLGDDHAPVLDRRLAQLRLAVHALGQPDRGPGRDLLVALADFGLATSVQAGQAVGRAAAYARIQRGHPFAAARGQASASADAWRAVLGSMRDLRSLGSDGARVIDLTVSLRRHLGDLVEAPDQPGAPAGPAALTAVRSAVLVLPDLAAGSAMIASRLRGHDLLSRAVGTGHYALAPSATVDGLLAAYAGAAEASRRLLGACNALPGEIPSPRLASYLAANAPRAVDQAPAVRPRREGPSEPGHSWAEIRDEARGVIRCPTDHLVAALRHSDDALRGMLHVAAPGVTLTGEERRLTLAALVATHLPFGGYATLPPGQPPALPEPGPPLDADGPGL
ncbi:hypothetical protein [Pseudofrankia sp. BMG5.37]|uniref:hypothetical protein n=1 Tax=Pseudofrankia sp. BMG5.37 TaxID=3050035 RepID=UPI00289469DC|nr:hypothetical protein [Pseudofrankia sp. BMG5.37]MDT3444446.1 hypothetical protein [Pseudofrankia sp. BMG5.37]